MCHMVAFNTWGLLNAFGILQTFYVSSLQRPPSDISWIGSIQAFLLFFSSTFSGRLTDAGYFHQTLFVGTCLQLLGIFAASASTTYWQLLLSHGICVGIGGGLVFCPAISLVSTYFSKRQSLALCICAFATSTGGLVFGALLQQLLPHIGFPWTMRVVGFFIMASMVPANVFLIPRQLVRNSGPMIEWAAFKDVSYSLFAAGMFFVMLGLWFPIYYVGSFGRDIIGISNSDAAALILIVNGAGLVGRILPTICSPYTGPINLLIPLTLISAILLFSWTGVKDRTGLIAFDILYGINSAAGQGMFPPGVASLTDDMSKMGVRTGMIYSIAGCACLIGTPIGGALVQRGDGHYLYAQIYAGMAMFLGVALITAARLCRTGMKIMIRA